MLTFNEYQEGAKETAQYPSLWFPGECLEEGGSVGFIYPIIGLAGEVGELSEKCKKILRDKEGVVTSSDKEAITKEIGDVLWYVAALCSEFDLSMEEVAEINLEKLRSRKERGKIQGSGDDR